MKAQTITYLYHNYVYLDGHAPIKCKMKNNIKVSLETYVLALIMKKIRGLDILYYVADVFELYSHNKNVDWNLSNQRFSS